MSKCCRFEAGDRTWWVLRVDKEGLVLSANSFNNRKDARECKRNRNLDNDVIQKDAKYVMGKYFNCLMDV